MTEIRLRIGFPDSAVEICRILRRHGKECYIVGGAVRDKLLGKEPHDIDIATDAVPDETERIFSSAGCRTYPTGKQYGTITVTCDGRNFFEVTTFRGEKYRRGSRKPEVTWGRSIREDLSRRDFTINAMAYDPIDGVLVDPFGGYEDLRNGIIRAVGDARERFSEDPLRIFRMCRFASVLGYEIDRDTFEAAKEKSDELSWIPMERKTEEFRKAFLKSESPSYFVDCLVKSGAMRHYMPEVYDMIGVQQPPPHMEDVYTHALIALDSIATKDYELRMAALLHDIGKPKVRRETRPYFPRHAEVSADMAEEMLRRTRHTSKEVRKIGVLVRNHMKVHELAPRTGRDARRLLRRLVKDGLEKEWVDEYIELVRADTKATLGLPRDRVEAVERGLELLSEWRNAPVDRRDLAISGRDLVELGVEPRKIGAILEKLVDYVVEDPSRNEREALLRRAAVLAKSMGALRKERTVR
ncbi:MAG: polynucleotide adenylyltransferase [Thermoprotei archaeon]|nr:MAG: polynucleotide adenylyltransferase [Thermoprotei archaeon]